jgi:hypothetical protein
VNKYKVTLTDEQGVVVNDWTIKVHKTLTDDTDFDEADIVTSEEEIENLGTWRVFQDFGGDLGLEIESHYKGEEVRNQKNV